MAVRFIQDDDGAKKLAEQQQYEYLGLPAPKKAVVRKSEMGSLDKTEEPKKKSSALPLVVGAAAVILLMSKK